MINPGNDWQLNKNLLQVITASEVVSSDWVEMSILQKQAV